MLTNFTVRTNFLLTGYNYTTGDLLLDPALPIKGVEAKVHTAPFAYVRSVRLFRSSGKIAVSLPYTFANWEGQFDGRDSSRYQSGFGDPSFQFSFNFLGSPTLEAKDYSSYQQKWVSGLSFQVFFPMGAYEPEHLINIGTNRFRFRMVYGVSRRWKIWILEGYGALWLFCPQ